MSKPMTVGKDAYIAIKSVIDSMEDDITKFYDYKKSSAGGRLRKGLRYISQIIKEEKKNVLVRRNEMMKAKKEGKNV